MGWSMDAQVTSPASQSAIGRADSESREPTRELATSEAPSGVETPAGGDVPAAVDMPPGVEMPAGMEIPPAQPRPPGFRERGRMRRRVRFLRKARELAYRDLGGLVFEMQRLGQRSDELVAAKLSVLSHFDGELCALEAALGERRPITVLREAGIAACPRCAAIHGSDDHFCPMCGTPMGRHADMPIAAAPATVAGGPAAVGASATPPAVAPAPGSVPAPAVAPAQPPPSAPPAAFPTATPPAAAPPPVAPPQDQPTEIIRPQDQAK
jgi:hypothetical protein